MVAWIELQREASAAAVAALAHRALTTEHVVRLSGWAPGQESHQAWEPIVSQLGEPACRGEDGASGRQDRSAWTDIRYDPACAGSFRHSRTAQPLHTDGAYERASGNVVFFACASAATEGGETIFVEAAEIAEAARAENPALFAELTEREVCFGKLNTARRRCTILAQDAQGWTINWNYYRIDSVGDPAVEDLRERFFAFLESRFVTADDVAAVGLQPGESLLFHDYRVLHGRRAFSATQPGERLIWKCNIHWPRRYLQ